MEITKSVSKGKRTKAIAQNRSLKKFKLVKKFPYFIFLNKQWFPITGNIFWRYMRRN